MTHNKRIVFFLSDSTGITAETIGNSLLSQFENIDFDKVSLRFIDSLEKAKTACQTINQAAQANDIRPVIFSTLVEPALRECISQCNGVFFDLFDAFILPLAQELHQSPSQIAGRTHGVIDDLDYTSRMDAVNYALTTDDGISTSYYDKADIVLLGVSRTGKTPTCLYLALHYGIYAANYPLTEEELLDLQLPPGLRAFKHKLFGLTISAERLQRIRSERRADSRYASLKQCRQEISQAEDLFHNEHIAKLDTTTLSVEEIATNIIAQADLKHQPV